MMVQRSVLFSEMNKVIWYICFMKDLAKLGEQFSCDHGKFPILNIKYTQLFPEK